MKKNFNIILAVVLVALGIALFVLAGKGNDRQGSVSNTAIPQTSGTRLEGKTDDQASVEVSALPVISSSDISFELSLNTHSGSLDQDLSQVSELKDETGKIYKPTSWDGAAPGGHHRSGVLHFGTISPLPKALTLTIKGIAGVDRQFNWNLSQ